MEIKVTFLQYNIVYYFICRSSNKLLIAKPLYLLNILYKKNFFLLVEWLKWKDTSDEERVGNYPLRNLLCLSCQRSGNTFKRIFFNNL